MSEGPSAAHEPELFVVSDGTGETAVAAVRAAATQFLETFRVRTFGETRHESQVRRVMDRAAAEGALVVFTVVKRVEPSERSNCYGSYGAYGATGA